MARPKTKKTEQCEYCRYFLKPDMEYGETPEEYERAYEAGDCRRYPPQIKCIITESFDKELWDSQVNDYDHPEVSREGWCGEFKAIIKKDLKS